MIKKDTIIIHCSDRFACSWYRQRFVAMLLMTDRVGDVKTVLTRFEVTDDHVLARTAAILFGRTFSEQSGGSMVRHYVAKRRKYGYRIFVDYDDLLFSLDGRQAIPEYNPKPIDTVEAGRYLAKMLPHLDGVTVSTEFLKHAITGVFGYDRVTVLPNAVPRYCFGHARKRAAMHDVPRVLYAGSMGHFKDGSVGDFDGPWVPWLTEDVKAGKIELHVFDNVKFMDQVADKVHVHAGVSSAEFPATIAAIEPDIYLAPLQPNNFNRAKSNLKLLEATAIGAVLLCSDFEGTPYAEAHPLSKVEPWVTPDVLRDMVDMLKDNYGKVMEYQRWLMDEKGYWMDSDRYLERFLRVYFKENLVVNGRTA